MRQFVTAPAKSDQVVNAIPVDLAAHPTRFYVVYINRWRTAHLTRHEIA